MSELKLVCPELLGGTRESPVLLGNRCRQCGEPFFPAAKGCTRCSHTDLEPFELGDAGTIWSWTMQMFQPKAPYDGSEAPGSFKPYGVGYVQMPCGLKVESRLVSKAGAGFAIGQAVKLVLEPYRRDESGADVLTYAFEPTA